VTSTSIGAVTGAAASRQPIAASRQATPSMPDTTEFVLVERARRTDHLGSFRGTDVEPCLALA
jgi:hypothetical protein